VQQHRAAAQDVVVLFLLQLHSPACSRCVFPACMCSSQHSWCIALHACFLVPLHCTHAYNGQNMGFNHWENR
jgi:hypothetical protein